MGPRVRLPEKHVTLPLFPGRSLVVCEAWVFLMNGCEDIIHLHLGQKIAKSWGKPCVPIGELSES